MRAMNTLLSFLIDTTVVNDSLLSPDQNDFDPAEPLDPYEPWPDDYSLDVVEFFQRYDR